MTSVDGSVVGEQIPMKKQNPLSKWSLCGSKKMVNGGFVDTEEKMCITPQFEDARSFSNGYAAVKKIICGALWM